MENCASRKRRDLEWQTCTRYTVGSWGEEVEERNKMLKTDFT